MLRIILFLIWIIGCNAFSAQTINLSDSLRQIFRQRITPSFKVDTRNSFIAGNTAKFYGVKAGVNFGRRFSAGIGYNFIGTQFYERVEFSGGVKRDAQVRMNYFAAYAEYVFFQQKHWEIGTNIQVGVGSSFHRYNQDGHRIIANRASVVLYEPIMSCEYKLFRLIGLGVGFGYRIMLKNNHFIDQQFTSPIYGLRVRLIIDEIYRLYQSLNTTKEETGETR